MPKITLCSQARKNAMITIYQNFAPSVRKVFRFKLVGFDLILWSYEYQELRLTYKTTMCWYKRSPKSSTITIDKVDVPKVVKLWALEAAQAEINIILKK